VALDLVFGPRADEDPAAARRRRPGADPASVPMPTARDNPVIRLWTAS
jgi:hypothetical protein